MIKIKLQPTTGQSTQSGHGLETEAQADEVRRKQQQLGEQLVQLATTVATLAGQLGGDLRPTADATELGESLETLRKLWEEARLEAEREQVAAQDRAAGATRLPLEMSLQSALGVFALTLAMCAGSGMLALRKLRAVDPAEVF